MNKNVPNILTIVRIIMVPFVILFYYLQIPHWNLYAAVIFIVASLTDMLDGMIARMEAELGVKTTVILTGGIGKFILPLCSTQMIYDEDLLIKGLAALYQENRRLAE